jgi:hypothetical protein
MAATAVDPMLALLGPGRLGHHLGQSRCERLLAEHPVDFLPDLAAIVIPASGKDPRGEQGFDPRMLAKPSPVRMS